MICSISDKDSVQKRKPPGEKKARSAGDGLLTLEYHREKRKEKPVAHREGKSPDNLTTGSQRQLYVPLKGIPDNG